LVAFVVVAIMLVTSVRSHAATPGSRPGGAASVASPIRPGTVA
jgi:hypothetical protein